VTQKTITEPIVDVVVDGMRRKRMVQLNADPEKNTRDELTTKYGQVWSASELVTDFDVQDFIAPYLVVRRKSDGKVGSMEFTHSPRFYFNFAANKNRFSQALQREHVPLPAKSGGAAVWVDVTTPPPSGWRRSGVKGRF
jgi:hypothetical protein